MNRTFPEFFAIIRDSIRPPCLQILVSYPIERDWERRFHDEPMYQVENAPHAEHVQGIVGSSRTMGDRRVHSLRCRHSDSGESMLVNWWFTPYSLRSDGHQRIPILEFQTRSWIPAGYVPIPLQGNIHEILTVIERIQDERLAEIRAREDASSHRYSNRYQNDYYDHEYYQPRINEPPPIRTPPSLPFLRRNLRRSQSPPSPRSPTVRIVEVQVPVERVVIQNKAIPLPKNVGDILLSHARKGSDSCPIAATPFAECEKLCVSSCFHIFDASSLARWQESHTSCPVCRSKIENVVSE